MPPPAAETSGSAAPGARRGPAIWKADLALLAITAIWGATFLIVQGALTAASPLAFNAARFTLAGVLLALVYHRHLRQIPARVWGASALLGLLLAVGFGFQTEGLEFTTAAKSAFLTGLSVVLVPFLVALLWRRRLAWSAYAGAVVALGGLYFLAFARSLTGGWGTVNRGDALTLLCAVAFAAQIAAQGEFAPRHGFIRLAVLQVFFAAVFSWGAAGLLEPIRLAWSNPRLLEALAVTAVLATAVAFTVQSWAQQFTPASHTAVIFAAEPVFAWFTSLALGVEALLANQIVGAVLVVAAILVIELLPARRASKMPLVRAELDGGG
ncbi:MAG: DMT family transporter [Terriglobales bacterium]